MSSIMCQISSPVPMRPSEMAVVRIIATVMVRLRRSPVATSESTKLTRMDSLSWVQAGGGGRPAGSVARRGGAELTAYAVDAARLVAGEHAPVELDDAA